MFQIYGIAVIFCFQLWGNSENSKKTKRLNKDEIKKQLIESITINNAVEIEKLNEQAEKVEKPEDAADLIKQYEEILRTKRKSIISVAFYQGKVFKLIEKHPKLMKSSVTLTFLKNYFKDIK